MREFVENTPQAAIRFKSLEINNGRIFKSAKLPLSSQGLVSILGKNATGKSTVWGLLEAVFYGSTPSGHSKDNLIKNTEDAKLAVDFERNKSPSQVELSRTSKKWQYQITENDKPPIKGFQGLAKRAEQSLGLTKPEFEGSIHLTQDSQHLLISGKPAQRRQYIANFFGIDDRFDQVFESAKKELDSIKKKIDKVSGLSHSKQLIEEEFKKLKYEDPEPKNKKVETLDTQIQKARESLGKVTSALSDALAYEALLPTVSEYGTLTETKKELKELEDTLINLKSKVDRANQIKQNNIQAREVNNSIDQLEVRKADLETKFEALKDEKATLNELETRQRELSALKQQNLAISHLRKELAALPEKKEIPAAEMLTELTDTKTEYQILLKRKEAILAGNCPECGSTFESHSVEDVEEQLKELQENIEFLQEDYDTVKENNDIALRRKQLHTTVDKVNPFTDDDTRWLDYLNSYIPAKREYDEVTNALALMTRTEVEDEVEDVAGITKTIKELETKVTNYRHAASSLERLPKKPKLSTTELKDKSEKLSNTIHEKDDKKQSLVQEIGRIISSNKNYENTKSQLDSIKKQLSELESLKKDEFFWTKMVDAYGPRGLRVTQLQKRMDLIIKRLPVYTSLLFTEKGLSFRHKCDGTSIEILACRTEVDEETGELRQFEHDISSFSGSEKDIMSVALILALADCVPLSKRSNILILDEVDSYLDEDGCFRFTNDLLPMLRRKYESVFVISHSKDVQQAAIYDKIWKFTKNNHWSDIEILEAG